MNGCSEEEMWIASSASVPGQRNVHLRPGETHDYNIPSGFASTRFWPKMGCNVEGQQCRMGSSGGPGQHCASEGCAPPVDSKFEATFGPDGGDCHAQAKECDWWDTSGVHEYTPPYKVEISDSCKTGGYKGADIDCSQLIVDQCPRSEPIGAAGSADLTLNVRRPGVSWVVTRPCGKLTFSN